MQLAAWVVLCVGLAYTSRRRPIGAAVAVIALWVLLPSAAADLITGRSRGPLSLHPATWLALAAIVVQLLAAPAAVARVVGRRIYLFLTLAVVVAAGALATVLGGGSGGLALLVDQVVGPVLLFLLVAVALDSAPALLRTLRTTLIALAGFESALVMVQLATGRLLVFESAHAAQRWFTRSGFDRWMGTLDHPLALALLLAVVTPLVLGIRRTWLQLVLLAAMGAAVLVTQSRVGAVAIAAGIVYVVVRGRAGLGTKTLVLVTLGGTGALLATSALGQGLQSRIGNDTGSAGARRDALAFFGETWSQHLVVGGGFTSSYRLAAVAGLSTSLENSLLMYAVDIGLVFAVLYFGAQAVIVMRGAGRPSLPGMTLCATLAVLLPNTYSALATGSAVGPLLWLVLAMADARPAGDRDPLPPTDRPHHGAVPVPLSRRTVIAAPLSE